MRRQAKNPAALSLVLSLGTRSTIYSSSLHSKNNMRVQKFIKSSKELYLMTVKKTSLLVGILLFLRVFIVLKTWKVYI